MNAPVLSIIVPAYNAGATIEKCLNSIKNQLLTDFECIVIDDGSQDLTNQICTKIVHSDSRFKIITNASNKGVSFCRNLGIKKSRGNLIGWVDSDDYVEETHFKELCSPLLSDTRVDIAICNMSIDKNGKTIGYYDVTKAIEHFDPNVRKSFVTSSENAILLTRLQNS